MSKHPFQVNDRDTRVLTRAIGICLGTLSKIMIKVETG